MKKKTVDSSLHSTRGNKYRPKLGLTGQMVTGEGFSKKANMRYKYINFNKEGESNKIEWLI